MGIPHSLARRRYRNPPVLEALIDVRVAPPDKLDLAPLATLMTGEEDRYPRRESVSLGSVTITLAPAGSATSLQQTQSGYRYTSADSTLIFQARTDGLTFSRLRPYSQWGDWEPEARRVWAKYCGATNPSRVTRIAVRYVNRILVKTKQPIELGDFLHVHAEAPPELSNISQSLMRIECPQPSIENTVLILTQSIPAWLPGDSVGEAGVAILLDLDVVRTTEFAPGGSELWSALDDLHRLENAIFESCITDRAREMFDGRT
jgi:uncharacterized protein (TIGR04255 family)